MSRVAVALDGVADPCLAAAGIPGSVVDLGLVQDVREPAPGVVEVDLALTEVGCAFTHHLVDAVERTVSAVEGVQRVQVAPVWTWEPGHARPALRADLRARAERLPEQLGPRLPVLP